MSLMRKLSIASVCLTILGQLTGWGGGDGEAETAAEVAMLVKAFSGGASGEHDAKKGASPADPGSDPAALLSLLTH